MASLTVVKIEGNTDVSTLTGPRRAFLDVRVHCDDGHGATAEYIVATADQPRVGDTFEVELPPAVSGGDAGASGATSDRVGH